VRRAGDGRSSFPRASQRRSAPHGVQQTEQNESAEPNDSSVIVRLSNSLTISEIRHLIARLLPRLILTVAFIWDWSRWRREHQVTAAVAHRKIRLNAQL
jgi:hypothetical protein